MGWQTTSDVAEFHAAAGHFLRADRVRNTVLLTVTETIRENPAIHRARPAADPAAAPAAAPAADPDGLPLFGWWTVEAVVRGAFLHTPPFPVLLTAVPAATAASLATTLAGRPVGGVNAHPEVAAAFAAAWREVTSGQVDEHRRNRLYRLARLSWPDPVPDGAPRLADDGDTALLTDWFGAFAREVNDFALDANHTAAVRERLSYRGFTVWEADGKPVSLAGVTRQVAGMTRVGPVYTPPEHRGHGYASAVTAAASERARAAGADEVLLFTDLDNPVSNSIYQRIGYRPVEDREVLSFSER